MERGDLIFFSTNNIEDFQKSYTSVNDFIHIQGKKIKKSEVFPQKA